jgi:hypothetical protein
VGKDGFMVSAASVFPNMSFVHNWPRVEEGSDEVLPFISIRQWQPISEDETEIVSWFAVDKNAPEEFKALSYKAYLMCFGSGGMFEQDDVENWVSLTSTAGGPMARRLLLNSRMGMLENGQNVVEPLTSEQYSGPGSTRIGYSEYNQRELLLRWADHLERPMEKAAQLQVGTSPAQGGSPDGTGPSPAAERPGSSAVETVSVEA